MSPRSFSFRRLFVLLVMLGVVALAAPSRTVAAGSLRQELAALARTIQKILDGRGQDSVAIGQFTGPPNFPTSAGPGVVQVLKEELEKAGVRVKQRAEIGIKGEYLLAEVEEPDPANPANRQKFLAVRITGSLVDQFGMPLTDFSFSEKVAGDRKEFAAVDKGKFDTKVSDERAVVELMGPPVQLPPDESARDRDNRLRQSLKDPEVRVAKNTEVSAGAGSPFAVEILVNNQPRNVTLDDGLPFVKLDRGEAYEVRLINRSQHDAAVRLTIDGLSVFQFSELKQTKGDNAGQPLYSHYVVPSNSIFIVKGWHRSNEAVDRFLVTEYAKSAAAELNSTNNVGTITAAFSAAWPVDATPPADEPATKRGDRNATGFGPRVEQKVKEVQRRIGVLRASVSVRYAKP